MAADLVIEYSLFEDKTSSLSINEVVFQEFEPSTTANFAFGLSESTFWIKGEFQQQPKENLILESCYTQLDELDLHYLKQKEWRIIKTGDTRPFENRDISHPCFVFELSNLEDSEFYFRVRSKGSVALPLNINESSEYWTANIKNQFAYGFLFAIIISMVAYNLFISFIIKDAAYYYYVIYLSSSGLLMAARTGHSSMYLWPYSSIFTDYSIIIFGLLSMSCGLQFVRHMGQIDTYSVKLSKIMNYCSVLLLTGFFILFIQYKAAMILLLLFLPIGFLLMFVAVRVSLANGWTPSYFLLLGFCLLLPGSILEFAQSVNWIKSNWFTQNALLFGIACEAICLSFALAYRIKMLNTQLDINRQKIIESKQNFSRKLLESTDSERRSIARDLHDGLAQNILALKSQLKNKINLDQNNNISGLISASLTEIRNITRGMHPQQLETLGLATAIKSNAENLSSNLNYEFDIDISELNSKLKSEVELHIFRIYQESINNIIKHSQATKIKIKLNQNSGVLILEICDNGIGFKHDNFTGIGITSMQERAALINGHFKIKKPDSGGTQIKLQLPYD